MLKKLNFKMIFIINLILFLSLSNLNIYAEDMPEPELDKTQTTSINKILTNTITTAVSNKKEEPKIIQEKTQEKPNEIFLNFENATLSSVVNYLTEIKKINYIPNSALDSINVTLTTRNALSIDKAWDILLTLLDINNFTMINKKINNKLIYSIVPKPSNGKEPLPAYSSGTGTQPEDLPDSDLTIRYIYFLKNIKAGTVQSILNPLLEPNAVQINQDLEALIITEKCNNIKAAMKIIKELDLGGLRESIKILKLDYANAQDIKDKFDTLIPREDNKSIRFITAGAKKQATYFSSGTKIFVEPRRNSLILLGTEKSLQKVIAFIKKYIDIDLEGGDSSLHIKDIRYAKAPELATVLNNFVQMVGSQATGEGKTVQVGEYKLLENVVIIADQEAEGGAKGGGNRLVVACNKEDWKKINHLIDKLDRPQPQVAFEVMIVDITLGDSKQFWSQFKPKKEVQGKDLGAGINFYTFNTYDKQPGKMGDVILYSDETDKKDQRSNLTFGKPNNLWSMIQTYFNTNNINVITQPFIVANNNKVCNVKIDQNIQFQGQLSGTMGTESVRNQVYQSAITEVTLTPKINLEGTINLQVHVSVQDFQSLLIDNPARNYRNLDNFVNIQSGEVLVLGGITKTTVSEEVYKTPILGDIPIIGNLFKSKSQSNSKTNLYIFIRPSIIKPRFDGFPDEYTQLKIDYAKYQTMNAESSFKEKDPIQRWFFAPSDQSTREKIKDINKGIYRPIDNYTFGYNQPKEVNIKKDPYFKAEENIEKNNK